MITKHEIYRVDSYALNDLTEHARSKAEELCAQWQKGENALLSELQETTDFTEIKAFANSWQACDLIFVGIGGSIMAPNLFRPFSSRKGEVTYFTAPDSVFIDKVLRRKNIAQTKFVILSKSGKTAETMAIFLYLLSWAEDKGLNPSECMVAVCENNDNSLHNLCQKNSIPCFYADEKINSRFSLWTPIGLLPAYLFGLDGGAVRAGAADYVAAFFDKIQKGEPHPLLASVAWILRGRQLNKNIHVMLHSDERLSPVLLWWQQLFAESLGKNDSAMTPLLAKLPEDLHVHFQLYLDGPDDKIFTALTSLPKPATNPIKTYGEKSLAWLDGSTLSQLDSGQKNNALNSLARAKRSVRLMELGDFSEKAYGALTAHFVLEILLLAQAWGVPAFGQPAIEQGKKDLVAFIEEIKNV